MSEQIEGIAETIRTLRAIEPALVRAAQKQMRSAAQPLAGAIRTSTPAAPLSGLPVERPRTSVRTGGRERAGGSRNLVKVALVGGGWQVAADMARRSSPGESFVANLTGKWGSASRWVWPTAESRVPAVLAAVRDAVAEVERQANAVMHFSGRG